MGEIEKIILEYFSAVPHIVSITLFGSQAENRAKQSSDVDVAVLFENGHVPPISTMLDWREDLTSALQKEVDLVCLNSVSPILGMQVHKHGKILSIRDEKEHAKYGMYLFSDYAELKELRAPMEKNILKRKYYD